MSFPLDPDTVSHGIQLAVAPVFLLTAVSGMIGAVVNRLAVRPAPATLRAMRHRLALLPMATGILFSLSSCGLVRLPFRVAGAVVEGTAEAGKMMGNAAAKPFAKTPEEKAAAAKAKAEEDEKKRKEKEAGLKAETDQHSAATRKANESAPAGIPAGPDEVPADDYLPLPPEDPDNLPPLPEGY